MKTCALCGQKAHWQAYRRKRALVPHFYLCSKCKPDASTAGSPVRQGVYYRPLAKEGR